MQSIRDLLLISVGTLSASIVKKLLSKWIKSSISALILARTALIVVRISIMNYMSVVHVADKHAGLVKLFSTKAKTATSELAIVESLTVIKLVRRSYASPTTTTQATSTATADTGTAKSTKTKYSGELNRTYNLELQICLSN